MKILLFLAVLSFHSQSIVEDPTEAPHDCFNNLMPYFRQLSFNLPDQRVKVEGQIIKFHNITLYDIDIQYIYMSYLEKPTPNDNSILLKLRLNNMRINTSIETKRIAMKIKAQFVISNFTFNLPLKFYKGSSEIYESVELIEEPFYSSLSNFTIIVQGVIANLGKKYIDEITESILSTANNVTALYDFLSPLIEKYGKQLFEKANSILNSIVNHQLQITIPIKNKERFIPIIQSPIVDNLRFLLNDLVADSTSPLFLNKLIGTFKNEGEFLNLTKIGKEFDFSVPIKFHLKPSIYFALDEITADGIDKWSDLHFLNPRPNSQFILNSTSTVGKVKINVSSSFNFVFDDFECSQPLNFSFELFDNKIDLGVQIAALVDGGLNYTNDQFFDLEYLVNLVDRGQTGITTLRMSTFISHFDYEVNDGFGGYFPETIRFLLDFIIQKNLDLIPRFLNGFVYENVLSFDLIEKPLKFFNGTRKAKVDVKATCISFGVAAFLGASVCVIVAVMGKYLNDKWSNSKLKHVFRTDKHASLVMQPIIPLWIRLVISVLLFGDIALFISSDASIGASLFLKLTFGKSPTVYFPSLYDFDFVSIVDDMWEWKSYFLSILLFVVSVLWPLVKLFLMIVIWFLPSTILKIHVRSRFLRVLDELGKWSLLDSFVLIVMFVAYRLELYFPIYNKKDIQTPNYLSLWFYPEYGFTTLILATLISSVISNIICFLNRKVKGEIKVNKNSKNSKKKNSVFKSQKMILNIITIFALLFSLSSFTYGICSKSVRFFFGGYAGWFIDLIDRKEEQKLSVIELMVKISKSSEFPNSFGVRITQFVFFILIFVVPYMHMISLFFLLLLPMKRKKLLSFYYASRVLYSWSCFDVFVISLYTSIFVMDHMSVYGKTCIIIHPLIKNNFDDGEMCFSVVEKVLNGAFVLTAAAVTHTVVTIWINVKARILSKDEENTEQNESDASLSENEIETSTSDEK